MPTITANFAAGPAAMPKAVLKTIHQQLGRDIENGVSMLELGHRTAEFYKVRDEAKKNILDLYGLRASEFSVLFLQGGARLQFGALPANLRHLPKPAYIVSGHWSKIAYQEAQAVSSAEKVWDGEADQFSKLPTQVSVTGNPSYLYLTSNETIHGVQFPKERLATLGENLVIDASSDFLSYGFDWSKCAMLFACAQKNAGIAGVTIAIMRNSFIDQMDAKGLPLYLDYKIHREHDSLYNTTPVFPVYVTKVVTDWMLERFGSLAKVEAFNKKKAETLYTLIDQSGGFYKAHAEKNARSHMNVVFTLPKDLETKFAQEAKQKGFLNIEGHRFLGGFRLSIYNAIEQNQVDAFAEFMASFQRSQGS